MVISVIRPQDIGNYGSFGEELGTLLGKGVQDSIRSVAEAKLGQLLERNRIQEQERQVTQAQRAYQGAGYNKDDYNFIQQFPEKDRFKAFQVLNEWKKQNPGQPTEEPANNQPQNQQTQPTLQELLGPNILGRQPQNAVEMALSKLGLAQPQSSQIFPNQQAVAAQKQLGNIQNQTNLPPFEEYKSPEIKSREAIAERKERSADQRHIERSNQKWNDSVDDKAEAAREERAIIEAFQGLDERGELDSAAWYSFLKTFGIDYPVLLRSGSNEFIKLSTHFLKNLKSLFGARPTNWDAKTYLRGIPDLSQTPEGRARLYRDFKILEDVNIALQEARDEIIAENGGLQPRGLRTKAHRRAEAKIDVLYAQLKQSFDESVAQAYKVGTDLNSKPDYRSVPPGLEISDGGLTLIATPTGWRKKKGRYAR